MSRATRPVWSKINQPFYSYLTNRLNDDVLFMNLAYKENPPMGRPGRRYGVA
jgi:hypothetical protein